MHLASIIQRKNNCLNLLFLMFDGTVGSTSDYGDKSFIFYTNLRPTKFFNVFY